MGIPTQLLPNWWCWLAIAAYGWILVDVVRKTSWWRLSIRADCNVFFAACTAVAMLWMMRAGVEPGLELHFLGATILTLMFGWRFAVVGLGLVLQVFSWAGEDRLLSIGTNGLLYTVLPVLITEFLRRSIERRLPANFFVYVFGCAFFAAAISMVASGVATTLLLWCAGAYDLSYLFENYAVVLVLMSFPEAFVSGGAIAIFVVYRPQWVATFDDARYLHH